MNSSGGHVRDYFSFLNSLYLQCSEETTMAEVRGLMELITAIIYLRSARLNKEPDGHTSKG